MIDSLEEAGVLGESNRLHEHILDHNIDIRSTEALCTMCKFLKVCLRQVVRRVSQVHLEHVRSCLLLWERNVNTLHNEGCIAIST
jgi:hypothetical protein